MTTLKNSTIQLSTQSFVVVLSCIWTFGLTLYYQYHLNAESLKSWKKILIVFVSSLGIHMSTHPDVPPKASNTGFSVAISEPNERSADCRGGGAKLGYLWNGSWLYGKSGPQLTNYLLPGLNGDTHFPACKLICFSSIFQLMHLTLYYPKHHKNPMQS